MKTTIWSIALCNSETWVLKKVWIATNLKHSKRNAGGGGYSVLAGLSNKIVLEQIGKESNKLV